MVETFQLKRQGRAYKTRAEGVTLRVKGSRHGEINCIDDLDPNAAVKAGHGFAFLTGVGSAEAADEVASR